MRIDENIRRLLENEVKIHMAEIRFLYEKLDHKFGLHAARIPVTLDLRKTVLVPIPQKPVKMKRNFIFHFYL